ncbi:hypothetical protein C8R44DRAFT_747853 [Mycena epipterygia]|nr:hypothetical protein C8R44DRAFT_747853 [Mycena epipterygia]
MVKRKLDSLSALTIVSDSSDSDDEVARPRQDDQFHRSIYTDLDGCMHMSSRLVQVPASPTKRQTHCSALYPDVAPIPSEEWNASGDTPFPFAQEEIFMFDKGHPIEALARDKRPPIEAMAQGIAADFRGRVHTPRRSWRPSPPNQVLQLSCWGRPGGVWAHDCFTLTNLKSLGRRIQLKHGRNGTFPGTLVKQAAEEAAAALPGYVPKRDDFCVVDSNGIHEVGLDFCSCALRQTHDVQLLRARLYPATTTNPTTAAMFRVLRQFHLLSLEAKCSAHHFYNSLARLTNNNGMFQPRRAGRSHAADGVDGTKEGQCALLCPACPQPGKNLPENGEWRTVPREKRFLYALFLAIDAANFRMKRKHVSSEEDDPSLGDGIAFFGKAEEYMQHLDKHWDFEQEKSMCVAHDAVDQPDRESYGTASSGIGTVDCARHNMKWPNGVGDLQKGERYINMDYMLWKSLAGYDDLVQLFIAYNIVCQWHKNIWRRLAQYKPVLRERAGERFFVWLIPKFHLPAHIEACNILFSFNLTPFVGQTDGEAPERGWANANPLASSTKEMGPGARRDALDDHFNDWNHKKISSEERVRQTAIEYRVARLALSALGAKLKERDWMRELKVLMPDDVRGRPRGTFSDPMHKQRNKKRKTEADVHAEARRKEEERPASWIWLSQLSSAEDMEKGMTEALRIEWAKTRARAWRWTEEVDLVEEEMRRVLLFLDWKAAWWLTLIDECPVVVEDETMREGFKAYALRQSRMQRSLKSRFEGNWKDVAQYIELGRAGLGQIPEEDEQEAEGQTERDTDVDVGGDAPVPEVARDTETIASFVEESLA